MRNRRRTTAVAALLCLGSLSGARPAAAATQAKRNEASWRVMDSLWDTVRKHPRRMKLLFSDRYYVEKYGAGHGFPYRAWHRVKIAFRGSGESRRIVVNRQSVLPIQRASQGYPTHCRHGVHLAEQELVFDERWRFKRARQWSWGSLPGSGEPDPEGTFMPPQPLRYGGGSHKGLFYGRHLGLTRSGTWAARADGDDVVLVDREGKAKRFRLAATRPQADAIELLLAVAVDLIEPVKLQCWGWPSKTRYASHRDGMADYDLTVCQRTVRARDGKPEVYLRRSGTTHTYLPATGEHRYSPLSYSWSYSLVTKRMYGEVLREFLGDLDIKQFKDRHGKVVDLPLGLKGLGAEAP